MSSESSEGRWPFELNGSPSSDTVLESGEADAATALLTAASEAADTDPLSLPTLNHRIDPDALEPLLTEFPADDPGGVRVAVEVTLDDVSVLFRDDGRIEARGEHGARDGLDPSSAVDHDWSSPDPLYRSIASAIASASDADRSDATGRLLELLDGDALDRILRPRLPGVQRSDSRLLLSVDGVEVAVDPGGSISVEPSLAVLERSGAALLVVGSVPEQGFDRTAATLLGDPDQPGSPVFVLHGRDLETASRRLSMAGRSPSEGVVLDHRATARGAAAAAPEGTTVDDRQPEVVPIEGGVEALPSAVDEATADVEPGALRICVDSLGSMIDAAGTEPTRGGIERLCRIVRQRRGIGSFVLPVDADGEPVERLGPLFDAVVELRTGDVGVEQRWHLTGPGHRTPWFPVG